MSIPGRVLSSLVLLAATIACDRPDSSRAPAGSTATSTDVGASATDGEWVMPAKNYASTRFSGLDQINTTNVGQGHIAAYLYTIHNGGLGPPHLFNP